MGLCSTSILSSFPGSPSFWSQGLDRNETWGIEGMYTLEVILDVRCSVFLFAYITKQ